MGLIDKIVGRVVGYEDAEGKGKAIPSSSTLPQTTGAFSDGKPPLPPRSNHFPLPAPPPYPDSKGSQPLPRDEKPTLPPRKALPTFSNSGTSSPSLTRPAETAGKPKGLSMKARIALSAALALASLELNTRRLVEVGSVAIVNVVSHKHGQEAGENARITSGTARNVVLVYVDVTGMGRRAIIKRAVKGSVRGMIKTHIKNIQPADTNSGQN